MGGAGLGVRNDETVQISDFQILAVMPQLFKRPQNK